MALLRTSFGLAAVVTLILAMVAVSPAEARRGGSFGSRGMRTYSAPRATSVTPGYVAPVQRSMTAPTTSRSPSYGAPPVAVTPPRPGFGGGFIGGLVAGGLIGGLMGHGWGGGGGWGGGYGGNGLASIIQLLILGFAIWWIVGLFRRRTAPAAVQDLSPGGGATFSNFGGANFGSAQSIPDPQSAPIQFAVTPSDLAAFSQLLESVQDAFGHEDFARLRSVTTPEVMSYLAEELSENSVKGVRNDVSGTRLLNSEISEAWREGATDYVTAALHYESIDVMRNRATGDVVSGDPNRPTEARELWTFVREQGSPWKLSAIQSA